MKRLWTLQIVLNIAYGWCVGECVGVTVIMIVWCDDDCKAIWFCCILLVCLFV